MPACIIRHPGVGYWTTEADYNRRFDAYREMKLWWGSTLVLWGIRHGYITINKPKEKTLE